MANQTCKIHVAMQWQKCGLIWQPKSELPWAHTHATLPIVQPIREDQWWVYVGCRNADGKNQIARIVLDPRSLPSGVPAVCGIAPSPVVSLGLPGAFDDSGVMPSWLVRDGPSLRLYYIGWNVAGTVPYRVAIGLAISHDGGASFQRYSPGPLIDRSVHEPYFVTTPCVHKENNLWRMWYASCTGWSQVAGRWEPAYHVKYAESHDGFEWRLTGISCLNAGPGYAVARPCVFKRGNRYGMLYSFRSLTSFRTDRSAAYRLGYAESSDGIYWERADELVGIERSAKGWDADMIEYCWWQPWGDDTYLLYNGNGFGRSGFGIARLAAAT